MEITNEMIYEMLREFKTDINNHFERIEAQQLEYRKFSMNLCKNYGIISTCRPKNPSQM